MLCFIFYILYFDAGKACTLQCILKRLNSRKIPFLLLSSQLQVNITANNSALVLKETASLYEKQSMSGAKTESLQSEDVQLTAKILERVAETATFTNSTVCKVMHILPWLSRFRHIFSYKQT